jgi:hypothetical protein
MQNNSFKLKFLDKKEEIALSAQELLDLIKGAHI